MTQGVIIRHEPAGFCGNISVLEPETSVQEGVPDWRRYWILPKIDCGIDLKFLEKQYGFRTEGYLPLDRVGKVKHNVGVLIGTNIDLSEWTVQELRSLGLNEGVVRKVAPYCQKRGQFALDKLSKRPLRLKPEEAIQLQMACSKQLVAKIQSVYDESIEGRQLLKRWEQLREAERTVIYDVLTQCKVKTINKGINDCPMFWNQVTEQNWKNSIQCLQSLDTPTTPRSRPLSRQSIKLLETSTLPDKSYRISPVGRVISSATPRHSTRSKHLRSPRREINSAFARLSSSETRPLSVASTVKTSVESVSTQTESNKRKSWVSVDDDDQRGGLFALISPFSRVSIDAGSSLRSQTPTTAADIQNFKLGCPVRELRP